MAGERNRASRCQVTNGALRGVRTMSDMTGASDRTPGDAEGRGATPGGQEANGSGEARPELDETSKHILEDARSAELNRLATPEIGTTTDLTSNQPRRGEP